MRIQPSKVSTLSGTESITLFGVNSSISSNLYNQGILNNPSDSYTGGLEEDY